MSKLISPMDLHIHSDASDGILEPVQIAELARARGLRLVAIADHDRLAASVELAELLPGVAIAGIELTCHDGGDFIDLLGLGLRDAASLAAAIPWEALNAERYRLWVAALDRIGIRLEPDAAFGGLPARRLVMAAVEASPTAQAKLGGAAAWSNNLRRALAKGGDADIAADIAVSGLVPDVATGIDWIRAAGGLASWAHPGINLARGGRLEPRLAAWVEVGLDALEVYHPAHDSAMRRRLGAAARHYGLLRSAGSDTHDIPDEIGRTGLLPAELVDSWLERLD